MKRDKNGDIESLVAYGRPAQYEGPGIHPTDTLTGFANRIYYYPNTHELVLEENAVLHQGQDSFSSPKIVYNLDSKILKSYSEKAQRSTLEFQPS